VKILYIQYCNPAAYPPLEQSSRLLADKGWEVRFVGIHGLGMGALVFPPHSRVSVKLMKSCPTGWKQKLHYGAYLLWALAWTLLWKPDWVYISDSLACPVAAILALLTTAGITYHEHDLPAMTPRFKSWFSRLVLRSRKWVAQHANVCVVPNRERAETLRQSAPRSNPRVVWNCPSRSEVSAPRTRPVGERVLLYYHGSINPYRVPLSLIESLVHLPGKVSLFIVGYETFSGIGHVDSLRKAAAQFKVSSRLTVSAARSRHQLMQEGSQYDIGLVMDADMAGSVGASVKSFDYLACGMAVLVPDRPEWIEAFVDAGYGLSCNFSDPVSIASSVKWFLQNPGRLREMGEQGRRRVVNEWNYDTQFAPITAALQDPPRNRTSETHSFDEIEIAEASRPKDITNLGLGHSAHFVNAAVDARSNREHDAVHPLGRNSN
jgi:glycosyltransferase involved in cell wall biosynthesis